MIVSESVTVDAPVQAVYQAFADLDRWPQILPDVVAVNVIYFDGYHQEFTMTVDRPAGPETVKGVRYCRPPAELELFQSTTPPGLARMNGRWAFEETGGRTTVVASRDFALADGNPLGVTEAEFGNRLRGFLSTNLELFRKAVEADGPR
ncbi:SRPBCC family protein [Streptomyces flavofungini]|uniref:SRPBCC family protein n=1 Tax=Streptomyces flavofungini TaxID=68200 RepID=A0ABS0XGQ1_9ACTN|nr:SRPBCC family protein [Streptomyces flavofungini]MBJ3812378.1 SRPBCC family protein [Streptomyces flavofungini]GHC88103.1 hypothetical protein GCM10010349_75120 [Streptomyces flavofungini]